MYFHILKKFFELNLISIILQQNETSVNRTLNWASFSLAEFNNMNERLQKLEDTILFLTGKRKATIYINRAIKNHAVFAFLLRINYYVV